MSERSARKWERGPLPSETKQERWWRTRKDPFEEVWSTDIEPLLASKDGHKLQALTPESMAMLRYRLPVVGPPSGYGPPPGGCPAATWS